MILKDKINEVMDYLLFKAENDSFAERLKEAMDSRKISAAELSKLSGVSKSSLSRYLSGSYKAGAKHSVMLAKALGVNEIWLMGFDSVRDAYNLNQPFEKVNRLLKHINSDTNFADMIFFIDSLPPKKISVLSDFLKAFSKQ